MVRTVRPGRSCWLIVLTSPACARTRTHALVPPATFTASKPALVEDVDHRAAAVARGADDVHRAAAVELVEPAVSWPIGMFTAPGT